MSIAGKCIRCKLIWTWNGNLLLREAKCPRCKDPLARTATRLIKNKSTIKVATPGPGRTLREATT